jgi:hypothetical protein
VVGVVVLAALVLVSWVGSRALDPAGEGPSGAGFTYRGEFYWLSGAEVRPDRLEEVLDSGVAFQDTTTDLRRIAGISMDDAVAASMEVQDRAPGEPRRAWLLLSPDLEKAADPWSDPELVQVVEPQP